MEKDYKITARCTFGLERALKNELRRLGYFEFSGDEGAVSIIGGIADVFNLNLNLRCANRVTMDIASFPAESFDMLFDGICESDLKSFLPRDAAFDVTRITSTKSRLFSKTDCQRIIKRAVVENLRAAYHTRTIAETGAYYPLNASIKNDIVTLSLDTSGESLHKRGYRLAKGEAPLIETLAAGIIELSGWERERTRQFADVMCGSGTFVIEAAMMAANIPPGRSRAFAFEKWGMLDESARTEILERAEAKIVPVEQTICGSDIDASVLAKARENAKRAGVSEMTSFQKMDFREFRSRKKAGVMIVNPPYGERMGEERELKTLYADLGKLYSTLSGWELNVLCAHPMFTSYFGKKPTKNRKLYNGNMTAYVYTFQ